MNRVFTESSLWRFPPVGFGLLHFLSFTAALPLPSCIWHSTFHNAESVISMPCRPIAHFRLTYRRNLRLRIKLAMAHCRQCMVQLNDTLQRCIVTLSVPI